MKYLIIGAGGTGGAIGAHMARAGKDVTLIARGEHLAAMQKSGLHVIKPKETFTVEKIKAYTMEEYGGAGETPDVILVCVKGYSVVETNPFIGRVADKDTIVIPILNIFGTGTQMQKELPELLVTDGCMYIASEISQPGEIFMRGSILRVVFGIRDRKQYRPELEQIKRDLQESDIDGILSNDIRKDALLKFSYVSPHSACGVYYDVPAGPIQQSGEIRDCFISLVREIRMLADAMGIRFAEDIVVRNLKILDSLAPEMTTSLQRDLAAGRQTEMDGQIFEVIRLARQYQVHLPTYEKIAAALEPGTLEAGVRTLQ